mmetsp:Transcript_18907/g.30728  ORF Transcript_18907/g.30728 Transcript_18907/m.30728 type:complete len:1146 (-) Transcript_18907:297-3734(-)
MSYWPEWVSDWDSDRPSAPMEDVPDFSKDYPSLNSPLNSPRVNIEPNINSPRWPSKQNYVSDVPKCLPRVSSKPERKAKMPKEAEKPKDSLGLPETLLIGSYGGGEAMQMARVISRFELSPNDIDKKFFLEKADKVLKVEGKPKIKTIRDFQWFHSVQVSSRVYGSLIDSINIMAHGRIFKGRKRFDNLQKYPLIYFSPIHGVAGTKYTRVNVKDPAILLPETFRRADQHVHTVDIDDQPRFGSDMAKIFLDLSSEYSAMTVCCIDDKDCVAEVVRIVILGPNLEGRYETGLSKLKTDDREKKGPETYLKDFAEREFKGESHVIKWIHTGDPGLDFVSPIKLPSKSTKMTMQEKVAFLRDYNVKDPIKLLQANGYDPHKALDQHLNSSHQEEKHQKNIWQKRVTDHTQSRTNARGVPNNARKIMMLTAKGVPRQIAQDLLTKAFGDPDDAFEMFKQTQKLGMDTVSPPKSTPKHANSGVLPYNKQMHNNSNNNQDDYKTTPGSLAKEQLLAPTEIVGWTIQEFLQKRKKYLSNPKILLSAITMNVEPKEQSRKYISTLHSHGYQNLHALSTLRINDYVHSLGFIRGHAIMIEKTVREMQAVEKSASSSFFNRELAKVRGQLRAARREIGAAKEGQRRAEARLEANKRELEISKGDLKKARNELLTLQAVSSDRERSLRTANDEIASYKLFADLYSKEVEKNDSLRSLLAQQKAGFDGKGQEGKAKGAQEEEKNHAQEEKEDVTEYVRKARAAGKLLQQILKDGRRAGYKMQHLMLAYNGRPVPGSNKPVSRPQSQQQQMVHNQSQEQVVHDADEKLARALHEAEEKRARDNQFRSPEVNCTACMEMVSALEAVSCRNQRNPHHYCMECFTGIVNAKLEENNLVASCSEDCPAFTSDDFYKVIDERVRSRIDQVHRDKIVEGGAVQNRDEQTITCPQPGCGNFEIIDDDAAKQMGYKWTCKKCNVYICIRCSPQVKLADSFEEYCNLLVDGGGHECKEDKESIIQDLVTLCERDCSVLTCCVCPSTKPCLKEIGCNTVSCPDCKVYMCNICGKFLSDNSPEAHDKFPHDNDVHGENGCKLFDHEYKDDENCAVECRRERSQRAFISKIEEKGYDSDLVATVLTRERNKNQFQGHTGVYESLLKKYS